MSKLNRLINVAINRHGEVKEFKFSFKDNTLPSKGVGIVSKSRIKTAEDKALLKAVRKFAGEVGESYGIFTNNIEYGKYDFKVVAAPIPSKEVEKIVKKNVVNSSIQEELFPPDDL